MNLSLRKFVLVNEPIKNYMRAVRQQLWNNLLLMFLWYLSVQEKLTCRANGVNQFSDIVRCQIRKNYAFI